MKRYGDGSRGVARCPAHEDAHASLSFNVRPDGTIGLHCFTGCATLDVFEAVGLKFADLFPELDTDCEGDHQRAAKNPTVATI